MEVDVSAAAAHVRLEGPVQPTCLLPVRDQRYKAARRNACVVIGAGQGVDDGTHTGLGGRACAQLTSKLQTGTAPHPLVGF